MDLRSLRYFTETVRLGSFTEAARLLGVTQSTISKMIRQLEDETGEPLLLRETRRLILTDTGKIVYDRGREILAAVQRLQIEIRETQSVARGSLAIGIPPMINLLFTEALKQFRDKHPKVALTLTECTGQQVEKLVASGELAAGMTVLPTRRRPDVAVARVATHRVLALAAPGMIKTGSDALTLQALSQLPLVLLNDEFALTRLLHHQFGKEGLEPRIAAQSGQWDWTVSMARAGMGVALLPEPFARRINTDGLDVRPVIKPEILWEIGILWNHRHPSHALSAWLNICRERLGGEWPEAPEQ
ncbi:LysR family transcriptional regulator [Orrella marina]|uniref:LysR family transcriptional regulator n=1 Tax=Orrella marina TaxID=2163011 RepID=A0A2R4XLU6_9BURK|nr:LysR family transcriptional regulator [Orrella marina]AWB34765.1 LysR family transcriptional regulator [Orrella marina]